VSEQSEARVNKSSWLLSEPILGTLIVIMTVLVAFTAFQESLLEIEGDDLNFEASKTVTLAIGSYMVGNTDFMQDVSTYNTYRFYQEIDSSEAKIIIEQASPLLLEGLERPDGPFDEIYKESRYAQAFSLLEESKRIEAEEDINDEKSQLFNLAGLIFAIGLAASAWAALVHGGGLLKFVFLLIAMACLVGGLAVVVQVLVV
jgi:hypothetical protein